MSAEQQVNLTDLEPIQLQEVKKQLDSVRLPSRISRDFPALVESVSLWTAKAGHPRKHTGQAADEALAMSCSALPLEPFRRLR